MQKKISGEKKQEENNRQNTAYWEFTGKFVKWQHLAQHFFGLTEKKLHAKFCCLLGIHNLVRQFLILTIKILHITNKQAKENSSKHRLHGIANKNLQVMTTLCSHNDNVNIFLKSDYKIFMTLYLSKLITQKDINSDHSFERQTNEKICYWDFVYRYLKRKQEGKTSTRD